MKQDLHDILDERAKLRVAGLPLALGLSLGLHLSVIAVFLWAAKAGSPPPQGQALNQEAPANPSLAAGSGTATAGTKGTDSPEDLTTSRAPILAGPPSLLSAPDTGIPAAVEPGRRLRSLSGPGQRHRRPGA